MRRVTRLRHTFTPAIGSAGVLRWGIGVATLALAACTTHVPTRSDAEVASTVAQITRRIPAHVSDRQGWARDIDTALQTQGHAANAENICAVLAIIEQESGYRADPAVANLPAIARGEVDKRAAALHIPRVMVEAALKIGDGQGKTYGQRLAQVSTERELSQLYEDIIARVPLGQRLFAGKNPVQTGGAMQVSVSFAQAHANGYPYPVTRSVRDEVFTRRGGVYFGTAHLLGYQTPYTRKVHRFADYNAGWYASRNAAFQAALSQLTGIALETDGDLLVPGAGLDKPGQTERALRSLGAQLGMNDRQIRAALERGNTLGFSGSPLHTRIFELAQAKAGKTLPRELIPGIRLDSPKITRALTTQWFAERVDGRYRQCLQR